MSWSLHYESVESFRANRSVHPAWANDDVAAEVAEQVTIARTATETILASDAIGVGDFSISLSGHANPSHLPKSGYANDCVTINIYQKTPEPPSEPVSVTEGTDG